MAELIKNHTTEVEVKDREQPFVVLEHQAEKGKKVRCLAVGHDGVFTVGEDYEVLAGHGDKFKNFGTVGYDMVVVEDDNGNITMANLDPDYPHAYEFGLFGILDESEDKPKKSK